MGPVGTLTQQGYFKSEQMQHDYEQKCQKLEFVIFNLWRKWHRTSTITSERKTISRETNFALRKGAPKNSCNHFWLSLFLHLSAFVDHSDSSSSFTPPSSDGDLESPPLPPQNLSTKVRNSCTASETSAPSWFSIMPSNFSRNSAASFFWPDPFILSSLMSSWT